ncbi:unnamed protein product [Hermetia illucens]|uniref:G-protein coupled receptors family 1 profile domain-containing protein n=1 Tax=Hermetia illucens TaxID=343691 RepID=A0A7R8YXI0_HERIL|nr:orexin receptor type 1-like isoform X2 [Hermetia illucens]CAD7089438.1 unnamed protein product [Hermetia illucens]
MGNTNDMKKNYLWKSVTLLWLFFIINEYNGVEGSGNAELINHRNIETHGDNRSRNPGHLPLINSDQLASHIDKSIYRRTKNKDGEQHTRITARHFNKRSSGEFNLSLSSAGELTTNFDTATIDQADMATDYPSELGALNDSQAIDHNETCVGDALYCNLTYEEYIELVYDYIYPTTTEWIFICLHSIVFIMGLVGNALVCIAVYTNYSMRTVTNIFIVNLAVADFFVILFCLPPTVVWDVTETWFMGEAMCKVVIYFQTVSVTVSVLTLTFISVDRWYAICFPLRYRTTIGRAMASVAFIWIVALISDIPEFLVLTTQQKPLRFGVDLFTQCVATWDRETEKNLYITRFAVLYTLPLLLMTVAYFKIVRVLWKSDTIPGHRESRNHQYTCDLRGTCLPAANTSTMGQLRARRKAAKMLVAIVVMFAGCYFPVNVLNILRYTVNLGQSEVVAVVSLFSHWLCYANSAVNPVIYNFMSAKFRREFRNALEKCRCSRVRVEDRSLNHSTPRINNISPSTRSNYHLTSVRDITRDMSRQTVQTNFIENCGNGHSTTTPMLNHSKNERYS